MKLLAATAVVVVVLLAVPAGTAARPPETASGERGAAVPGVPAVAYRLPVTTTALMRGFEPPTAPWGPGHRGVDLAADPGSAVVAPGDGVVTFAGDVAGRGVVTVAHADGLRSSVEPVVPGVETGDRVAAGEPVGRLQDLRDRLALGHCAPQSCLHWGVRRGTDYVNPLRLLLSGPTVLLPLGTGWA